MMRELEKLWKDESGAEFVEWAVVVIILLVAALLAYQTIGRKLNDILQAIWDWLDQAQNVEPDWP